MNKLIAINWAFGAQSVALLKYTDKKLLFSKNILKLSIHLETSQVLFYSKALNYILQGKKDESMKL